MARNPYLKRIKRTFMYYVARMVITFFRCLPRRAALAAGSALGRCAAWCVPGERRRAARHLTIAFRDEKPPEEIERLSRAVFPALARNFVDTVRIGAMRAEAIDALFVPHGMDRLREVLGEGRGVIAITSHTGCWEMLGAYLAVNDIPIWAIARRLYDPRLERLLLENREHAGVRVISRGNNTRDIIRVLKNGGMLGVLVDQDTNVKGTFVDFFGTPAHTAVAPAQLALRYDVPALPVFTYRDEHDRHHACIGEPLTIERTGDIDEDVRRLTGEFSAATEAFIREHPKQWVWFHRRWKTQPPRDAVGKGGAGA